MMIKSKVYYLKYHHFQYEVKNFQFQMLLIQFYL